MGRIDKVDGPGGFAQRNAPLLLAACVLSAFLLLAAASTIYDIGRWVALW